MPGPADAVNGETSPLPLIGGLAAELREGFRGKSRAAPGAAAGKDMQPAAMRFEMRPPRATDVHATMGFRGAPLAALAVLAAGRLPEHRLPPCVLKRLAGLPCPACGARRAVRALADGAFADAWRLQPLLVAALALLPCATLYAAVTALFRLPRLHLLPTSRERRRIGLALCALTLLNWCWLLLDGR